MDWQGLLETLIYAMITVGLPIVIGQTVGYIRVKRDKKVQSINNTYVANTLIEVTDIIFNVVDTVGQTYVDDLKRKGSFDKESQKEALEKALTQTKALMNEDMTGLVVEKYNDLDEWLRTQIESYIKSGK